MFKYIWLGLKDLPEYGNHPGTPVLFLITFTSFLAGTEINLFHGLEYGIVSFCLMFIPYLIGAYGRGKSFSRKNMETDIRTLCMGCGRIGPLHKMCPAWGTPYYMSGKLFTPELEKEWKEERDKAIVESTKRGNSGLD
jgi:hypothetical protein